MVSLDVLKFNAKKNVDDNYFLYFNCWRDHTIIFSNYYIPLRPQCNFFLEISIGVECGEEETNDGCHYYSILCLKKKRHDEGRIVLLNASMNSKTITKMEVSFGIYA